MSPSRRRAASVLQRSTGALSTAATARMASDMPWFNELSAQHRSWVGMIVQAGIRGFVEWYDPEVDTPELATMVFGAAPRELTGVITLKQTVDLIRVSIEVVESNIDHLLDPADAPDVHQSILRYAREVAFATAEVYARAAEVRGAWDARLEALVVDAVVRSEADETVLSRASALGWGARGDVAVVLGAVPGQRAETDVFEEVRRVARAAGMDALCATQGERLVVVLGGVQDARKAAHVVAGLFGEGPVVVGPVTDDLSRAHASARAALSAHRAADGWPEAPRPVCSDELLPERALAGDGHARRHLVDEVYLPLLGARGTLVETLSAYMQHGCSIEATARTLFVHPNTVRYRLRQVADVTGLAPATPRDGFTLQIALVLGRQSGRS
ncbi:PucR family transcriptional regulator [Nocardioides gansuensis]|uniref:PucR family transcriptional regulator n=1 Tax=Nocardioides gansuensis TaxID=2138300 RepID=A0A2T8F810_9ACTN|nr:helix-turn-helix domain-containing protein [Nocardioides gansuensis]PVG81840.1 PucR family transcriptional regulator [Nocardioides gansuensis]